jgi:hypothetical protein
MIFCATCVKRNKIVSVNRFVFLLHSNSEATMPSNYKVAQRRKKKGKKGKGSSGSAAHKAKSGGQATKRGAFNAIDHLASSLHNLPSAPSGGVGRAQRIPPEERTHCWNSEQIERFLSAGEWDSDDERAPDNDEDKKVSLSNASVADNDDELRDVDLELRVPLREMPAPKPVNAVFGGGGAGDQQGALLGSLLDPNAGGANKNSDGLMGLLASQQPQMKAPEDPRERLRARLRYMERQRSGQTEEDIVRDKKGRKMKNVRNMTPEDMLYGGPKARNAAIDKGASAKARQDRLAALRATLEAKAMTTSESAE